MSAWYRFFSIVLIPIFACLSLFFVDSGFSEIENFRKLERIPLTNISGSVDGEVQLSGVALKFNETVQTPDSHKEALYYRYTLEEEYRDSDGDRHWRTIKDESASVDFLLNDNDGQALLVASRLANSGISWIVNQSSQRRIGDWRHTEWTIMPGEKINVIGWMQNKTGNAGNSEVLFTKEGNYVPIISERSVESARRSMGSMAMLNIWAGITASVFLCFAILFSMRRHKVVVFLVLVTSVSSVLLLQLGLESLRLNVADGAKRVTSNLESTHMAISDVFAEHGRFYNPVSDQGFDTKDAWFNGLSVREKDKLNNWRITAFEVRYRYLKQVAQFPEAQYAAVMGLDNIPQIRLPEDLQLIADERVSGLLLTRTDRNQFLILLGLLIMVVFSWLGFRTIRFKRMQENVVATKVGGVSYGLAETNGKLIPLNNHDNTSKTLIGPLSKLECCWYHYIVKEKRGSGKKASWVTIKNIKRSVDFRCEDATGSIYIDAGDAEFITRHSVSDLGINRRYYEKSIRPNDQLYVFGLANITSEIKGDELCFSKPEKAPFIVSNYSEEEVKFFKGTKGLLLLSLGISLMFLCSIWVAGSQGNFSSIDFFLASLSAPALSLMMMILFMYNDLIFLKKRCDRNFSNIQVALKKRFDLIPLLIDVINEYFSHEKKLQEELANIRLSNFEANDELSVKNVNDSLNQNAGVLKQVRNRISVEAHPDLKAINVVNELDKRLVHVENEIELIRTGFNNAVTEYNTRIAIIPDVFIAKIFKFKERTLLVFDEVHKDLLKN